MNTQGAGGGGGQQPSPPTADVVQLQQNILQADAIIAEQTAASKERNGLTETFSSRSNSYCCDEISELSMEGSVSSQKIDLPTSAEKIKLYTRRKALTTAVSRQSKHF